MNKKVRKNIGRIKRYAELAKQVVFRPQVCVVGSYHGMNLGDNALKYSVMKICDDLNIKSGWTTNAHVNLAGADRFIMGGGAIFRTKNDIIEGLNNGSIKKAGAIGVDVKRESIKEYPSKTIQAIKKFSHFSVRSKSQRNWINSKSNTCVEYAPDNAFCLPSPKNPNRKQKIGFNVVGMCIEKKGEAWVPIHRNKEKYENQGIINYERVGAGMKRIFRSVSKNLSQRGYELVHIPFTPRDEEVAEWVFENTSVDRKKYTGNPLRVIEEMSSMEKMIGCRYHSNIFAILTETPLISVAYARKCERLWEDMNFEKDFTITRNDISEAPNNAFQKIVECEGFKINKNKIIDIKNRVINQIKKCILSISD